ncbi:uncharacterized protein LOC129907194 [Episyrphus balteatus]|uniref:uncharacterized protein LOC129907194 n=1 Tax=Episyrphus balteatus TaxID=286459 RepID=UPI002486C299|nr:uncharacterized protein LOC129907194 [Episyrphus balteatus]
MLNKALFVAISVLCFNVSLAEFNCSDPPIFPKYDIGKCCRVPHIDLGSAPQKCIKEIDAIKTLADLPAFAHVCYPECIYRYSGVLQNGEVEMESVQKFLRNSVHGGDQDIVPVIMNSFESCMKNIREQMNAIKVKMYAKLPDGCSPYSSMIWGCVNTDTFINCPEKMWKNEKECNLVKNFVKQCNPLPHVPLPAY